jgi:hypothetical protein
MQQLSSKNYRYVIVRFRGDDALHFTLHRDKGDNLMRYLATANAPSKHVVLTDIDGTNKTVHTSEIVSADPLYETETDWSKYTNLDELKADRKPSVQADVLEVSDEVRQHRLEVIRKMKEDFQRKREMKS